MIDLFQAFWLAFIQGLTEFLPISSSGHLVLIPKILGWPDQGLAFDVAVHVGTLIAVLIYFRRDIYTIARDWLRSLSGAPPTPYSRLAWSIAFATVMVGTAGLFMEPIINRWLREPIPVAIATIVFGALLGWADHYGNKQRTIDQITWRDVLMIGAAQILSLIPGTSRSGITITTGLAMGLTREAAARFSFLMAIPVIALAGVWQSRKLTGQSTELDWHVIAFGTLVSAVVAFVCIHWFLGFLRRFSLTVFVIYRMIIGGLILWIYL
ncbi:MAG: undecaprenyl-diphosphate phosphatase [bacterium]